MVEQILKVIIRGLAWVVFFAVVCPLAFVLKAFGRDVLSRRLEPKRESYWES